MPRASKSKTKTTKKTSANPPAAARTYVCLSPQQKVEVVRYARSCPWLSPNAIAKWAAKYFSLEKPPARNTVSNWIKIARGQKAVARRLQVTPWKDLRELEPELAKWVVQEDTKSMGGIATYIFREHARRELLAKGVPENKLPRLSNGWMNRFQRRYNVWFRQLCGEAGSVSQEAIDEGRKRMKEITAGYQPRDIYNMDETAFFYREVPRGGLGRKGAKGRKQRKERMTVAVTANADGSHRLPLLVVSTAAQPTSFRGVADQHVHFVYGPRNHDGSPQWGTTPERASALYAQTAKGWMTKGLFKAWLEWLNNKMKRADRKILLLVDNVSSHTVLPYELSNVKLEMLPKNTTAVLQPMDQGVIWSLKSKTTRKRAMYAYERWRAKAKDPYMISSWEAFSMMMEAWSEVTKKTLVKCWAKADILSTNSLRCSIENILW